MATSVLIIKNDSMFYSYNHQCTITYSKVHLGLKNIYNGQKPCPNLKYKFYTSENIICNISNLSFTKQGQNGHKAKRQNCVILEEVKKKLYYFVPNQKVEI